METTRGERRKRMIVGAAVVCAIFAVVAWLVRDVMSQYWSVSAIDEVYRVVGVILGCVVLEYFVVRGVARERRSGIKNTPSQALRIFAVAFFYLTFVLGVLSVWIGDE
jgi:uncharacterized membrane protein